MTKVSIQTKVSVLYVVSVCAFILAGYSAVSGKLSVFMCVSLVITMWALNLYFLSQLNKEILAVNLHALNLEDGTFSSVANEKVISQLRPVHDILTGLSKGLMHERQSLYERNMLVDNLISTSSTGILVIDESERVVMSNQASSDLLLKGAPLDGQMIEDIRQSSPYSAPLFNVQQSGLVKLDRQDIWHVTVNEFDANHRHHKVFLFRPIASEIQREELLAWRKLLQVIGHELNNTLAPLSSLAYSGKVRSQQLQQNELSEWFDTISLRCKDVNHFVQSYMDFSRAPTPNIDEVSWSHLINQLQDLIEFEFEGELPQSSWNTDPSLLFQVILNLLKNSHESGSPPDKVRLWFDEGRTELAIYIEDEGGGIDTKHLNLVFVPFFTTKQTGTGIGLPLCRDIMEALHGSIHIDNTARGLRVTLTLPRSFYEGDHHYTFSTP